MWSRSLVDSLRYNGAKMPLIDHLAALRSMLIRMGITAIIGLTIAAPFTSYVFDFLRLPAAPYTALYSSDTESKLEEHTAMDQAAASTTVSTEPQIRLQFAEPASAVKLWLWVTFFVSILLTMPVQLFFIGQFILPGIREREQRVLRQIWFFSGGLFFLGIYMGYEITLPLALGWMLQVGIYLGGESIWFYSKYILFCLQLLLAFGLAFQLPVVLILLGRMKWIGSALLREKRRHVIIVFLVLAMLLTPPDVLTQLLLAAPLIVLYELCIWILHWSGCRYATAYRAKEPTGEVEK